MEAVKVAKIYATVLHLRGEECLKIDDRLNLCNLQHARVKRLPNFASYGIK